jgi:hypothetical protein
MAASADILHSRLRVPDHVVYRTFGDETVVVNLRSGKYHGLNRTAARMLDVLSSSVNVEAGVTDLARELGVDEQRIRRDASGLCRALMERGLVELGGTRD